MIEIVPAGDSEAVAQHGRAETGRERVTVLGEDGKG